ncbi:SPBc2 prophage-derived transglycosylase, partial [Paenibacillus sp. FSL R5-192]
TVTMAAATAGLSLLVGAIAIFAMKSGEAEKAERDRVQMMKDNDSASQQMISQYQRQIDLLPKMVNAHNSLKAMIDGGTLSTSKQEQAKRQLEEISKALAMTIGKEGLAQLEAAGFTDEATQIQISALNTLIDKQREARKAVLEDQRSGLQDQMNENIAVIEKTKEKIESLENSLIAGGVEFMKNIFSFKSVDESSNELENLQNKLDSLETKNRELEASISDANVQMQQMTVESVEAQKETDALAGINGKASDTIEELTEKLVEQTKALRESVQASISSVSELNQVADTLSKGQSLSASSVADLILKYPELASQIRKTTDGWIFEG